MDFPPLGLLKISGKPVSCPVTCRFLHPRSGEKYRRVLQRSLCVAVKGSPIPLGTTLLHIFVVSGNYFRKLLQDTLRACNSGGNHLLLCNDWCCSSLETTDNWVTVEVFLSVLCGKPILYCNVLPCFTGFS